jgi:Lar family restriction alleviation protein
MTDQLRECPFCGSDNVKLNGTTSEQTFKAEVCCENPACYVFGPKKNTDAEALAAWNTRPTSEREARLVEALKVCEQDRVRLYGDGQTLKDAISNQVDDVLAAYSETKP